jgi:hypothetical protein
MEKIAKSAFIVFVILAIVIGLAVGYMAYSNDPNYANTKASATLIC